MTTKIKCFKNFSDTVQAILDDYLIEGGAVLEIKSAVENLEKSMSEIKDDADAEDTEELDFDKAFEILDNLNPDDINYEKLLPILDEDELREYVKDNEVIEIKCTSLIQKIKLRDFLETEIYPYYQDQKLQLGDLY